MIIVIEPLSRVFVDDRVVKLNKLNDSTFGGFCSCGGEMVQRGIATVGDERMIIVECKSCWKTDAIVFNGRLRTEKVEVEIVDRRNFKEFLKKHLTELEYESLIKKAHGEDYNYNAFSRAKKKLEDMGFDADEVLLLLQF